MFKKLLITLALLVPLTVSAAVVPTSWFRNTTGGFVYPLISTDGVRIPSLTSLTCLGTDGDGDLQLGTCGGSSGGGTWSTTTSQVSGQLINYPNNTTDIVVIGSNATTSGEFFYDPNTTIGYLKGFFGIGTTSPFTALGVAGTITTNNINATGSVTSTFTVAPTFTSLTSALVLTGAGGLTAEYTGTTCTNQFVRALSVLGVATCESIGNEDFEDDDWGEISVASNVVTVDDNVIESEHLGDDDWGDITIASNAAAVEDDSHAHTSTSISGIDISADTNLTAGDNLTLTDDDLDLDVILTGLTKVTTTYSSTTDYASFLTASTTNLILGGVSGDTWDDFCVSITGSSALCDGDDAEGAGGTGSTKWATTTAPNAYGIYPAGAGYVNFGTTTHSNITNVTISSSTAPQLSLSSGDGFAQWVQRNAGDNLYFATTTTAGTATTSISALSITGSSGNVGIGLSNPNAQLQVSRAGDGLASDLFIGTETFLANSNAAAAFRFVISSETDAASGSLVLVKSTGTNNAPTTVTIGDTLGIIQFQGYDGGDRRASSEIKSQIDATPSSSAPGNLIFSTARTVNLVERMRIGSDGYIGISTTTSRWPLQIASSTGSQLTLSDPAVDTNLHWSFRNAGGNFYLATSSASTFATSTTPSITIDSTNTVTFGNSLATCIALTGSTELCDGDDEVGAGGTGSSKWATTTNEISIYPAGATGVVIGGTATTTNSIFQVIGTSTTNTLQVGSTAIGSNVFKLSPLTGLTVSTSESVGGLFNCNTSTTDASCITTYRNSTGSTRNVSIVDDADDTGAALHIRDDGNTTAINLISSPQGNGAYKWSTQSAGDADGSGISLDGSTNGWLGQLTFFKCGTNSTCSQWRNSANAQLLTISDQARIGAGTTTPAFQLQIASSTGSQIALSSADSTSPRYNLRAIGDNFYFATSSATTFATSTTPIFTVDSTNTVTFGNSLATCIALTGSAALCDGDDATGAGGGDDPFTHTSFAGAVTSATSTLLNLTGSPLSLAASSTYANLATTSQLTLGAYGSNVGIYFTEDGDGAVTIQGIGNANNESITANLDDSADIISWSSATGITGWDMSQIRMRSDGVVIDGDGTFPASSDGSILIGDGTDTGTFELEDGPACIGDGGCTPDSVDGSLTLANNLFMPSQGVIDWLAGDVTLTHSSGALTLSSSDLFDLGGSVLEIPNGSAPTVDAIGEIAVDSTNDQLIYFGATAKRVIQPFDNLGFAYATTTWSGTTTLRVGPSPAAITVTNAYCETNTGTVGVSLYDGTNRALYMPTASTTINNFLYTASNNSFTAGETIRVDIGTPASSPTQLSCRFLYTYDAT